MNISQTSNKCTQKCTFSYNYPETSVRALLTTSSLNLAMSAPSIPAVKFNGEDYNATSLSLVYPSSNTYNGVRADAEIIILNISTTYNIPLIVSIPVTVASNTKPLVLDDVIKQTSDLLPKRGYVDLKVPNFSLNDIIPNSAFYYTETPQKHYIMYDLGQSLSLSSGTFELLKKIVINPSKNALTITNNPELFYNNEGANTKESGGSDFNFMQCEEVYEEETSTQSAPVMSPFLISLKSNPDALNIIFYSAGFIAAIAIFYFFYKVVTEILPNMD